VTPTNVVVCSTMCFCYVVMKTCVKLFRAMLFV